MTICVGELSSVPINGRARMPSHKRTTGGGQLEQLLLLARGDVFSVLLKAFDSE
jgi:hypothetical protein